MSSVLLLIFLASFCPCPAPNNFLPTVAELSKQTKDETSSRNMFWFAVMSITYLTAIGVGTAIMNFPRRWSTYQGIAHNEDAHQSIAHDEDALDTSKGEHGIVGCVFFTTFTTSLATVVWSISTDRLSRSTGLDFEIYWVLLSLNCLWMLAQAVVAKCTSKPNEDFSLSTFAEASLSGTVPFFADSFDTLRDIMFGGICFSSDKFVLKVLGVVSWLYLALVHVYFLCEDDHCLELQLNYASVLYAPHKNKNQLTTASLCERAQEQVLVTLYKLTTRTKVWLILIENSLQAVFAVVFLYLEGGSPLVMTFNLVLPAAHILFALSVHRRIARKLLPHLKGQLKQAIHESNVVKVRTVIRRLVELDTFLDLSGPELEAVDDILKSDLVEALQGSDRQKAFTMATRFLNVGYTKLTLAFRGLQDVSSLGEALKANKHLQELKLNGNQIKDVSSLGEALKANKHLQELWLKNNQIEDVSALADGLKANKSLTKLNLERNHIKDVSAFAEGLKANKSLTRLGLMKNHIKDVSSLGEALKANKHLQELDLRENQIEDVSSLGEALKANESLEELFLDGNQIKDVSAFAEGLMANKSLKYLSMSSNEIEAGDKEKLKAIAQEKGITIRV